MKIRRAGRIVAECHEAIAKRIAPGVTTLEIDRFVERLMAEKGAYPAQKGYRGYPYATCASVNDVVCHGFPDAVPLHEGDVVTIDMVAEVNVVDKDSKGKLRAKFVPVTTGITAAPPTSKVLSGITDGQEDRSSARSRRCAPLKSGSLAQAGPPPKPLGAGADTKS